MRLVSILSALCLACLTIALSQKPLQDRSRQASPALFEDLEELSRIVDITYCVGATSLGLTKPFSCLSRCSDFPAFELVTTWNTGPLLSDSCGYIALDHGKERVIVAFRGTYSVANTIVDLSTVPQEWMPYDGGDEGPKCENCTVHMGFYRAWVNTRDAIVSDLRLQLLLHSDYTLHLVGHSLGGAVAALAALDLQADGYDPIVTTFGEPRIGNEGLAKYLDARFYLTNDKEETQIDKTKQKYRRVTHTSDPVPLIPLTEWSFAPHAGEIFIAKADLSPDVHDLRLCAGDSDPDCIAGEDSSLLDSVKIEVDDVKNEPWGIPTRYKLWQLFFAHRDYFWRLGLCVPGASSSGREDGVGMEAEGFKVEL